MITKKDILEALGAQTEDHFLSGLLIGIGVGAVVGSAVAFLFAPKTGEEMRQMLGEKGSTYLEKAKSRIGIGKNGGAERTAAGAGGEPGAV